MVQVPSREPSPCQVPPKVPSPRVKRRIGPAAAGPGGAGGAVAVTALTAASPLAATPPASWGVSATNTCITPGIWSSPMSAPPGSQPAARRLDSGPAPHSATVVQFVADEGLGGLQRAAGRAGRRRINLDADLVPVTVLAAALVAIGRPSRRWAGGTAAAGPQPPGPG